MYISYFSKVIPTGNFFMPRLRIKTNNKYEKTNHKLWDIKNSRYVRDTNWPLFIKYIENGSTYWCSEFFLVWASDNPTLNSKSFYRKHLNEPQWFVTYFGPKYCNWPIWLICLSVYLSVSHYLCVCVSKCWHGSYL